MLPLTRAHRMRSWRRPLSLLLLLVLGLSSVEVVWGDARSDGTADAVLAVAEGIMPAAPDCTEGPLRHAEHDVGCACLCACACPGAGTAILPTLALSEAPTHKALRSASAPERLHAGVEPEPPLRPPLA